MSNTLIAFAAKAGSTANDGEGAHSPFTTALLNISPRPDSTSGSPSGRCVTRFSPAPAPGRSRTCMDRLAAPRSHSSLPGKSPVLLRPRRLPAATSPTGRGVTTNSPCRSAPGRMGRVPCCASDRLLRRPCACPTRQAFGRARGSTGRSAGPGGFDAVAARTADAGQDIDAAPGGADSPPARAKPKPAKETASGAANRSRSSSSSGCSYVRRAVAAGTAAGLDNGVGLIAFGRSCGG